MMKPDRTLGLYLHVPFCLRKCRYCDFYSAAAGEETRAAYVAALCAQLRAEAPRAAGYTVDTVYFGGGTPTLFTPTEFLEIIETVGGYYALSPTAEITAECNPVTGARSALAAIRRAGVNRLSVGVQSMEGRELALLGRLHNEKEAAETILAACEVGFDNISADVMLGIPAQTPASFERTLRTLAALPLTHLSAYALRVEEGTPFAAERETLALPDDDAQADLADLALRVLTECGFTRYEISNYARNGRVSAHNMKYWQGDPYLGFGPGAHSFFGGERYSLPRDTGAYLKAAESGTFGSLVTDRHAVRGKEAQDEYVMLRMRLFSGVDTADFSHRFGTSFEKAYGPFDRLAAGGFLKTENGRVAFTARGMLVSNTILSEWLDFGNA